MVRMMSGLPTSFKDLRKIWKQGGMEPSMAFRALSNLPADSVLQLGTDTDFLLITFVIDLLRAVGITATLSNVDEEGEMSYSSSLYLDGHESYENGGYSYVVLNTYHDDWPKVSIDVMSVHAGSDAEEEMRVPLFDISNLPRVLRDEVMPKIEAFKREVEGR